MVKHVLVGKALSISVIFLVAFFAICWASPPESIIARGRQPQISIDQSGHVRIVFGRADSIFCRVSKDAGESFNPPQFVGYVPGMQLGMTRGPQLASSAAYSVISAMDTSGNIHWFQLAHHGGIWTYKGRINDADGSAPEGLMALEADVQDNFYAVWLDIRVAKNNQIFFSSLPAKSGKWTPNRMIYQSPDGHVCECCKPSIAVRGPLVVLMYRNWLNGSRDIYLIRSDNGGKTFGKAQKLGKGTWKLNGCPMDGGGLSIDAYNKVHTVWRREGTVFYSMPGDPEIMLEKGKICSISKGSPAAEKTIIAFQEDGIVKLMDLQAKTGQIVGKGSFLKTAILPGGEILCCWEQDKEIKFRKL
ncbi:hypothetical protein [Flavihumibacter fluvii]|uniref:hypothetical protein n=1 Tax=Flavihumibacter fluvii TaxID=2838157 RepID=UPI001BDE99E3|nr:hypothetical protein [Flavihumibacter fluvii]ULQ52758.1 hypothetical protein KJS93_00285 [Flavihumibacter fluvii]